MKTNIGSTDRIIRIVIGLVILGVGYYFKSWWGLVGLLPIATAVFRFCPGYAPFGFSTCAVKPEDKGGQAPPAPGPSAPGAAS